MNAYLSRRSTLSALLFVAATALGACTQEPADGNSAQALALAAATEAAGPSVVTGLGGDRRQPALQDTIDLRKIGYSVGAEDAPVTVYEFSDFGCPFCGMFARATYPEIHEEFVETGMVRWTYVPFVMGMFPNGDEAARAAECAAEQDRFWEMHDLLYDRQNDWKSARNPRRLFNQLADELGLDDERFAACYRENRGAARTTVNNRAADALGVRATPTFFVNGRMVEGALPSEQFKQLLQMMAGQQ